MADLPKAMQSVYELLWPLDPDDRRRVVKSALALLDDYGKARHKEQAELRTALIACKRCDFHPRITEIVDHALAQVEKDQ